MCDAYDEYKLPHHWVGRIDTQWNRHLYYPWTSFFFLEHWSTNFQASCYLVFFFMLKAYLEYEAQFEELRTEFSVDDITDPDKLLDEWENVEVWDVDCLIFSFASTNPFCFSSPPLQCFRRTIVCRCCHLMTTWNLCIAKLKTFLSGWTLKAKREDMLKFLKKWARGLRWD